jgi:hypothetical protein
MAKAWTSDAIKASAQARAFEEAARIVDDMADGRLAAAESMVEHLEGQVKMLRERDAEPAPFKVGDVVVFLNGADAARVACEELEQRADCPYGKVWVTPRLRRLATPEERAAFEAEEARHGR